MKNHQASQANWVKSMFEDPELETSVDIRKGGWGRFTVVGEGIQKGEW